MKYHISRLTVFLGMWSAAVSVASDLRQIPADPDLMGTGAEFHGTLQMKAGDRISFGMVDLGGFVEVRNEPRFNQGLFPNHNWRGFISGSVSYPLIREMQGTLILFSGLQHESAHATMGIVESTIDPYAMIYDHQYRKFILNALPVGAELIMYDAVQRLVIRGCGSWYFLSKNTPELSGLDVSNSGGITLNGEYRNQVARYLSCYLSVHERFIFRGSGRRNGEIYIPGDDGPEVQRRSYPIISRSNTITVTAGISLPLFEARRQCDVYVRFLYGNIYGYVDSREQRAMVAAGVALWDK